ncbi:hypothetical protein AGMMS50222_08560 [Endomicrobiia bacterium]|nr:hypothetical protein AGMMS49556_04700 [Endomicrobiia bacterium]GHT76260.1 hypothetical protein AGMMS50222_08560 [Endomicrobiia bacterium]
MAEELINEVGGGGKGGLAENEVDEVATVGTDGKAVEPVD